MQMCLLPFCFPPQPAHKRQGEWKCLIMSLSVSFIYLYAVVKNSLFPCCFFFSSFFYFFYENLDRHFKWALCLFSLFPPSLSEGIHLLSNAWRCSLLAPLWHHASRVICKGTHVGIKNHQQPPPRTLPPMAELAEEDDEEEEEGKKIEKIKWKKQQNIKKPSNSSFFFFLRKLAERECRLSPDPEARQP